VSRLQPVNLIDFTGGINSAKSDFQLADNESPSMLNMEIDPRVGFYTRPGWTRWNPTDIVASPTTAWRPRNAQLHLYSNGAFSVFIANAGKVWAAGPNTVFTDLGLVCDAAPHLADPASWGDVVYIATGHAHPCWKVTNQPTSGNKGAAVAVATSLNWNNDYTIPKRGVMPAADHLEPHGGYIFAASTQEDSIYYPNRLRWSHTDEPEDWAKEDFIDIEQGGGRITAIRSFRDHLLIFKLDSMWALYGYDSDSWQLIKVSGAIGTPAPTAVTRSEDSIYFYSASGRNAIYAYQGESPINVSEKLRYALDQLTSGVDIWLSWVGRRLWCSLPWDLDNVDNSHGSLFIFDPTLNGAWIRHKPATGTIACIVEYSDIATEYPLVVTCGCVGVAGVLSVDIQPAIAGDVLVQGQPAVGFRCRYRTSWKHLGWPELRKSFLRPRVIARIPPEPTDVRISTYWDYNSTNERRSHVFSLDASGGVFWRALGAADPKGQGFNWGDGTNWSAGVQHGDVLERPKTANPASRGASLGWARAIQMEFAPNDYTKAQAWGVDAIVLKVNMRRFTT
jgi:hypothetical protein